MSIIAPIVGAVIQSNASKKAAKTQAEAAEKAGDVTLQATKMAIDEYRRQFDVAEAQLQPFREVGLENLRTLAELNQPGGYLAEEFDFTRADFEADPGYQFRLEAGMKALERQASARGNLLSGKQLKAAQRYSQDFASQEFDKAYTRAYNAFNHNRTTRYNRLAALAGVGQTSTNTLVEVGDRTSARVGDATIYGGEARANALVNAANARASGYIGSANAWAYGIDESSKRLRDAVMSYGGGGFGGFGG